MLERSAVRANGAVRPTGGFEPYPRRVLVMKVLALEYVFAGCHLPTPLMVRTLQDGACGVNYVIGNIICLKE
jgi:hypothetical protein